MGVKRYVKIWQLAARMQALRLLSKPAGLVGYAGGKLLRMAFFLIFGIALFKNTAEIAGFSRGELLVCYAIMNMVDVVSQMIFLRGLNSLQLLVKKGGFDALLVKPMSALFWVSVCQFDWIDFITLPGAAYYIWYAVRALAYTPTAAQIFLACLVSVISCATAYGVMLIITSVTFSSEETENLWWTYRDFIYSARNPPPIFPQTVQWLLTFVIPIFTIISFPAYALIGRLTPQLLVWACIAAVLTTGLGLIMWRRGVRAYSSASS